ncbi:hypothetical protein KSS87_015656, partial [Heliosperma pusillum]
ILTTQVLDNNYKYLPHTKKKKRLNTKQVNCLCRKEPIKSSSTQLTTTRLNPLKMHPCLVNPLNFHIVKRARQRSRTRIQSYLISYLLL